MKEIKNDPNLLSNLMQLAMSDSESSVRQMAAVILRKDLSRKYSQERVTFLRLTLFFSKFRFFKKINYFRLIIQTVAESWRTESVESSCYRNVKKRK